MKITASEIRNVSTSENGNRTITEAHTLENGDVNLYTYLADAALDIDAVLTARVANINAEIDRRNAALAEASNFEIPLTRLDIIRRITAAEWDLFCSSTIPDIIRFKAAFDNTDYIYRNDPLTQAGFAGLVAVGILATGRPAEILV
jgi:hypothetical protein